MFAKKLPIRFTITTSIRIVNSSPLFTALTTAIESDILKTISSQYQRDASRELHLFIYDKEKYFFTESVIEIF